MNRPFRVLAAALTAAASFLHSADATAAEIRVLCALGMKEVVEDLALQFERVSGHRLMVTFSNLGNIIKRIEAGETAELVILPQQGIARLVKEGRSTAADTFMVAYGDTGVAVRKGAAKPDISTPAAFKAALLAAKTISYLDPAGGGVSGIHVAKVLERLAISDEIRPKTILHRDSNEAAALIESGKAEIGINLIQELLPKPGIDVVGPLPGDLQLRIPYAAAIMSGATNADAARAFVDFVRGPKAALVIKARGMAPAG